MSSRLTAIAAVAENGIIGDGHDIPWELPDDWKRFKKVTMGGVLVMGRATHDAIGRPLPGRDTIVLTRNHDYTAGGVTVVHTVEDALAELAKRPDQRHWIAGGGEIYYLFWSYFTDLDLTEVHRSPAGTTHFPRIDPAVWHETSRTPREGFDFVTYQRR